MADLPTGPAWAWSAVDAVAALRRGDVSPVEMLDAAIARIEDATRFGRAEMHSYSATDSTTI